MPSREEIARWLRQAGEFDLLYTAQPSGEPSLLGIEGKKVWEERAAQVENMRCETCKRYVSAGNYYEKCRLKLITEQGKNFGCFSWEAKGD